MLTADGWPEGAFEARQIGPLIDARLELVKQHRKVGSAELRTSIQARDHVSTLFCRRMNGDVGECAGRNSLRQVKADAKEVRIALSLRRVRGRRLVQLGRWIVVARLL